MSDIGEYYYCYCYYYVIIISALFCNCNVFLRKQLILNNETICAQIFKINL